MLRYFFIAVIAISFWGCIEKYDFTVANESEGVVIEAFISNQSYNNTRAYPSDGRYFSVKLTQTSDVTNVKGANISGAAVVLSDDQGNSWTYEEDTQAPGEYYLYNPDFAATYGVKYQLRITTPAGNQFESNWETLPASTTTVGPISIKENIAFDGTSWRKTEINGDTVTSATVDCICCNEFAACYRESPHEHCRGLEVCRKVFIIS